MDQPDTAAMPYHGFDTRVYILLVGPHGKRLNVQSEILTKIPSFKNAVKNGKIKQDIPYSLSECDPKAMAMVLAFVRDGELPAMVGEVQKPAATKGLKEKISNLIMAYQLTLDLDLEAAQNAIIDRVSPLLANIGREQLRPNPSQSESFRKSKIHLLISRQLAYQLQEEARQRLDVSDVDLKLLTETFGSWQKNDLLALMAHLLRPIQESPVGAAVRVPCLYHVHEKTESCHTWRADEAESDAVLSCDEMIPEDNTNVKKKKRTKAGKSQRIVDLVEDYDTDPSAMTRQTDVEGGFSTLQTVSHSQAKREQRRRSEHQVGSEEKMSGFEGGSSQSNNTLIIETTHTNLSQEGWSDLNADDNESQSTMMGILTPKSLTISAASPTRSSTPTPKPAQASTFEPKVQSPPAIPHRNRGAFRYIPPRERPVHAPRQRLCGKNDVLDQTLAYLEQDFVENEIETAKQKNRRRLMKWNGRSGGYR